MKKSKKFVSLFLALMMALSVMAVTAAAYGEETHVHSDECCEETTIMPRKPGAPECYWCDQIMTQTGSRTDISGNRYIIYTCKNGSCPKVGTTREVLWNP